MTSAILPPAEPEPTGSAAFVADRSTLPLPGHPSRRWPVVNRFLPAAAGAGVAALVALIWLADTRALSPGTGNAVEQASAQRSELVNRLRLADRVLRSIAADVASRGQHAVALGATEKRYFDTISYVGAGAAPVALLGTIAAVPALGDVLSGKLAHGESVIVAVARSDGGAARAMLVRGLARLGSVDALLMAEIAPRYLWEVAPSRRDRFNFCVRDDSGAPLQCSSPAAMEALRSLGEQMVVAPGPLQWQFGVENWSGASVGLDLAAPYTGGNWSVVAIESAAHTGVRLGSGLGTTLLGATLLGALAGLVLLRRRGVAGRIAPRGPNSATAAEQPGGADTQAGEPADRLALMLARQRRAIQAMADIDRASLSRVNAQRLMELAAGHLLDCTGCDVLLIGVLDCDLPSCMTVVLASKGGARTEAEQKVVDPSTIKLLSVPPDGIWLRQVREFGLLEPQAQLGAQGALVFPIYDDGKPLGIISLGFTGASQIGSDESGNARALVGRLGAALTSAARAQALYAYTHFDATTALPNRQYLKEHLAQQIKQARRNRGRLALLFIDLDGFKKVNASLGHNRADLVLAEAASRMRACVREEDVVTRFGGDEFVVVLPRVTEGMDARRVADKLLEAVAKPYLVVGDEHHLGCSIGISVFPDDAQTVDRMLRNADSAMFSAKEAGRGRYMFFDAAVNRAAVDRTELERDLRRALANAEFSVAYQPQIDLRSGRIDAVEALVRWHHPSRGMVPPAEFIPVAERAGLIGPIGEYVMRTAYAQFHAWETENIAPRRIAVNVSGMEIARSDIVARVEGILRDTGLRPMHLELELTEGIFMDHSIESLDKLRHLRQIGVRIAMDDFGTGYSSLSYLQRLPFDVIKIDQSFVRELGNNQDTGSIVRAIMDVAHSLGKSVVAEGVETEQQRLLLAAWGCDVGQGYLWSRPLGASEFGDFCRAWHTVQEPALAPA